MNVELLQDDREERVLEIIIRNHRIHDFRAGNDYLGVLETRGGAFSGA